MTQILESIAIGTFGAEDWKCPFKDEDGKDVGMEDENISKDDRDAVVTVQSNNGGTLGGNLEAGRHSSDSGTFNDLPRPAPNVTDVDRWRRMPTLYVPFTAQLTQQYGPGGWVQQYHSSAHHLIPGNAALSSSDLFKKYMKKGGKAVVMKGSAKLSYEIKFNIGYNVNGSHNGVWLPNNFGVQATGTPTGLKWSSYTAKKVGSLERSWVVAYIATATKWKGRQFHDSHTTYNGNVKKLMQKLCKGLQAHQALCDECESKSGKKIPPPYKLKLRLYAISRILRGYTTGHPYAWRDGYLTSDQFAKIKGNAAEWAWFQEVYHEAKQAD